MAQGSYTWGHAAAVPPHFLIKLCYSPLDADVLTRHHINSFLQPIESGD